MTAALGRLLVAIATVLLAFAVQYRGEPAFAAAADPAGNTKIVNTASATWQDNRGNTYQNESNPLGVVVQPIAALTVTPKETAVNPSADGYPANQNVTRTFVISNVSNIADEYKIASVTADKGQIVSVAFVTASGSTPVTIGSTVSPLVQPGDNIGVQVTIATTGIAVGTSFALHLTAQTTASGTANGLVSDTGEQWLLAAAGPTISGPTSANAPISKTVNQLQLLQSQPGAVVTYDVVAKNYGGTPATNAVVTDPLPAGVTVDTSSVKVNGVATSGASLSGQTLTVQVGTIDAGATVDISFNAQVEQALTIGSSFVNTAQLQADGVPSQGTSPASVLIGTADIVFDPVRSNAPIAGATISLFDVNDVLVPLNAQSANTKNPYITGSGGTYGFPISPSQISSGASTFYLTVTAPGYLNRRIKLVLTRAANGQLYNVAATSQDGQPLASAGGFALTASTVSLNDVFGLFGNIPLFKTQTITIDKTVNQTTAQSGDRLIYTIEVGNPSSGTLGKAVINDTLPAGEAYAARTARLDGAALEPAVHGRVLTWTLSSLAAGTKHRLTYACVVFPSVTAGTLLTNAATASALISGTMVNVNASASADVEIVGGALGDRSVITGRVFFDAMRTGHFAHGDRGLGGVRIYLEDGSSVVTDEQGRFSFPAARPGMHVLRVDSATLPAGMHGVMQRLVHGVLDDGLMQDIEFPLGATP